MEEQKITPAFYCSKCNRSFRFNSQYKNHCKTGLHKTGQRKCRSDKKNELLCSHCNLYTTRKPSNLKLHILNNHSTIKERQEGSPFYCDLCNSGFMKNTGLNRHLTTKKHQNYHYQITKLE